MTEPPAPQGISHLRCSDEDRELVAQVLNNAYADGRLDFDEHSERITQAYNAKTFADLDQLTVDLIPPASAPATRPQPAPVQPAPAAPPPTVGEFTGGRAILGSYRSLDPVALPAYSELTVVMGDARIDLSRATFTAAETVISANVLLGELRIRVPLNVRVVNDVSTILGDFKSEGTLADPGAPVLRIAGTCFLGDVKVMGPDVKARKYEGFVR